MRSFLLMTVVALLCADCGARVCTPSSCAPGSVCDEALGHCVEAPRDAGVARDAGVIPTADAGAPFDAGLSIDAGPGSPCGACSLATPVCDVKTKRCVRCTLLDGCQGDTPTCDISFQNGLGRCERCVADGGGCSVSAPVCDTVGSRCVECLRHSDCASGLCNLASSTCFIMGPDGGFVFDAGLPPFDAGVPYDGGGPLCPGPRDAGMTCTTECPAGFFCNGSECILNGRGADLQVTLRWDSTEDVDLHLDEPLTDGGVCEIWYGARTPACAMGALDLDSQAGCSMDLVLIENIIYPTDGGRPPAGTYAVRVDHWSTCSPIQWVPFQVEVRKGISTFGMCGVFKPSDPDWNAHGAARGGRPIMTFTYP